MENENSDNISFLWYSVAMFYKYSTVPYYISMVYVLFILKDWPFVYSDKSSSLFWIIGIILFTLVSIIMKLETDPEIFKAITPSSWRQTEESFINQYRLCITFLRWIWLFIVFFLLNVNSSLEHCTMDELSALKQCHRQAVLSDHIQLLIIGFSILIVIYCVLSWYESNKKHDKKE